MKVLIVGAGGFVGRYLTAELVRKGHSVISVDKLAADGITSVDILDYTALERFIGGSGADAVFHLAASAFVNSEMIESFYSINVIGTLNVLRSCLNMPSPPWVVYISSSLVYGKGGSEITEMSSISSINHYAASKIAAEAVVQAFTHESGLKSLILRPFNHTGVGQSPVYLIPKLVKAFRDRTPKIPMGNLQVTRDFLDVRDVVKAYGSVLDAIDSLDPGRVFNICSGRPHTIDDILTILRDLSGFSPEIVQKKEFIRENDITYSVGVNYLFKETFGWDPRHSLHDTLDWMYRA